MAEETNASTHFTWEELTHTNTGIPNPIDEASRANMRRLCAEDLEPLRKLWGVAVAVNSGFRCLAVNTAVKGSGWKAGQLISAHVYGRAADLHPEGLDIGEAFEMARKSDIPYDKLMIETKKHADGTITKWIHVQCSPSPDVRPRRLAFSAAVGADGNAVYAPVLK